MANQTTASIIKRPASNFQIKTITGPKPIVWNIATLTPDTLFIFDFKANRALGYFDRERLINQHPELIRYLTDAQDKDWLIQQRLLSPSHRTYRILLFVLDEVSKIAHTDAYRLRPNSKLNELTGFKVPEFMLQKMRNVFMKLSEKNKPISTITATAVPTTTTLHGITMPGTYTVTTQPNHIKTIQTIKPILVRIIFFFYVLKFNDDFYCLFAFKMIRNHKFKRQHHCHQYYHRCELVFSQQLFYLLTPAEMNHKHF